MKEISYIHSEAYAAGELKHGTISLIEDGTLVVGVLTQQALFEKTIQQYGGGKEPWSLSHGPYQLWKLWSGRYSRFLCLCSEDRTVLYDQSGNSAAAADGILCQRG